MKTYTKTTIQEAPMLRIEYDQDVESPRKWRDNLGYFVTNERNYQSPDGMENVAYNAMRNTECHATDTESHMRLMKKDIETTGEKVLAIYPVKRYEHGNVKYSLGTGSGFDTSNCGFYIVLENEETKSYKERKLTDLIAGEIADYTKWTNGEVYGYILYNEAGEMEQSCWGFYNLEDIKQDLPKEWESEDMEDYLINQ